VINANESFLIISPSLQGTIQSIPRVSLEEFIDKCEPADIISSYLKSESFTTKKRMMWSRILGLAQGSLFTTLKLVKNKKIIIGYGTRYENIGSGKPIIVEERSLERYLKHTGGSILMRPVKVLTPQEKKQVIKYMTDRIGLRYNVFALFKTAWDRFTRRKITPFFEKKISDKELKNFQEPLFCSTIITFAYKSAGINLKLSKNIFDTWPRDYLLSPNIWKICYYKAD